MSKLRSYMCGQKNDNSGTQHKVQCLILQISCHKYEAYRMQQFAELVIACMQQGKGGRIAPHT